MSGCKGKAARLAAVAIGALALGALPVLAHTDTDVTLSKAQPSLSHEYQGWTSSRTTANPIGDWDYAECMGATATYCTAIVLHFQPQARAGYNMSMTVTWPAQAQNATLQGRIYTKETDSLTGQDTYTPMPGGAFGSTGKKLILSPAQDLEAGDYYIGIICWDDTSGPCPRTFTLAGELKYEWIYEPPPSGSPRPSPRDTSSFTPEARPNDGPVAQGGTTATPDPVLTLGTTGGLRSMDVTALGGTQQASKPSNTAVTVTNLVLLTLVSGIVFGGGAAVALRIKKDLRRDSSSR